MRELECAIERVRNEQRITTMKNSDEEPFWRTRIVNYVIRRSSMRDSTCVRRKNLKQ